MSSPPRLRWPRRLIPGTTERPIGERTQTANAPPPTDATSPVHHTPSPPTDNYGDEARPPSPTPPPLHAPDGSFRGRRDTNKSKDPSAFAKLFFAPNEHSRGRQKAHLGKNTATILSDAPTSPPAPGHTEAPAGKESAKKKDSRERITALSARTRSQVAPKTRPAVAENPEPQHRGTEPKTPARRRSREDLPASVQHGNKHLRSGLMHPPPHKPSGKIPHSLRITDCGSQAS